MGCDKIEVDNMDETESNIEQFPCQCGCGELAPPDEAYISGHDQIYSHYRHWAIEYNIKERNKFKPKPEPKLCACGCGEYALPGNDYIFPHKMAGGDDIVGHYVAYDFGRPEALIVKVTRSFHGQIHNPEGCKFGTRGYSLID